MNGRGHARIDRAATVSGVVLRDRAKYFAEDVESATLEDHLDAVEVGAPPVRMTGIHELVARTAVGDLDPAVMVARWAGPARPSLILHHGNNERPFDLGRTAKNLFGKALLLPDPPDANVLVVRAPFHAGSAGDYLRAVRSLNRFAAMLATGAAVTDTLVAALRAEGSPRVVVSGLSLGGWITNLHRAHRNTADVYVPVFAGAALAEVFLTTSYGRLASRQTAAHAEQVRHVLNFEHAFTAVPDRNVFPLLARYDQYIDLDRQRRCYRDQEVAIIDKGHVTGGLDGASLRAHVTGHLVDGAQVRALRSARAVDRLG